MKTIACTHCDAKYRVDPARFSSDTPRIRCKKCGQVFQADLRSEEENAAPAPAPAPAPEPTPPAAPLPAHTEPDGPPPVAAQVQVPVTPSSAPASEGTVRVLFAHESDSMREQVAAVTADTNLEVRCVDNGVDALVVIEQGQVDVAVLDVALPRMFGFEVCEVVRRDHALDQVKLVLIAAIYDQNRYRRPPSTLHGADGYIEKQSLVEDFTGTVQSVYDGTFGTNRDLPHTAPSALSAERKSHAEPAEQAEAPATPTSDPVSAPAPDPDPMDFGGVEDTETSAPTPPAPAPAPTPTPAAPAAEEEEVLPEGVTKREMEKARRLGRVIVSDLALYNKEVFEKATSPEDIYDALEIDIHDSREQINIKVSEAIRNQEDVLDVAIRAYLAKKNA